MALLFSAGGLGTGSFDGGLGGKWWAAPAVAVVVGIRLGVDARLTEHVSMLTRAYSAIDTVTAARIGIDDAALKNMTSIPDALDDVSRALVEVREGSAD